MTVTELTGLRALILGWLEALEGWLCPAQPEGRGNYKVLLPNTSPHGPARPLHVLCWTDCDRGGGYFQPRAPLSLTG